jgi:hypothetical protein
MGKYNSFHLFSLIFQETKKYQLKRAAFTPTFLNRQGRPFDTVRTMSCQEQSPESSQLLIYMSTLYELFFILWQLEFSNGGRNLTLKSAHFLLLFLNKRHYLNLTTIGEAPIIGWSDLFTSRIFFYQWCESGYHKRRSKECLK